MQFPGKLQSHKSHKSPRSDRDVHDYCTSITLRAEQQKTVHLYSTSHYSSSWKADDCSFLSSSHYSSSWTADDCSFLLYESRLAARPDRSQLADFASSLLSQIYLLYESLRSYFWWFPKQLLIESFSKLKKTHQILLRRAVNLQPGFNSNKS